MANVVQQLRAARISLRVGERDEALRLAREALKRSPHSLLAHRLLAWLYLDAGSREAFTHFQQCAQMDPEDPLALVGQAIYAESNGVAESALQHFVRAAELAPGDEQIEGEIERLGGTVPDTELARGIRALHRGEIDAATDHLRRAAAELPEDPAVKLSLARALWARGATDEAVNLAQQVLSSHPQSIAALMIVLAAEVKRGRGLRARDIQARADAIDPGFALHPDLARLLALPTGR